MDYIIFLALWFVSLVVHWQVTISTCHSSWTWTMQTDNWLLGGQIYSVQKCSLLTVVVISWVFCFFNTCSVPYFAQNVCVQCNPRAPCACTCHIPMFVLCIVYILCLCHFVNLSVSLFVLGWCGFSPDLVHMYFCFVLVGLWVGVLFCCWWWGLLSSLWGGGGRRWGCHSARYFHAFALSSVDRWFTVFPGGRRIQSNNNNVHLSCTHQRPERSHDTY